MNYYLENVPKLSKEVGYIPLQDNLYPIVAQRYKNGTMGSIYQNGEEQGTSLESLLTGQAAAQH